MRICLFHGGICDIRASDPSRYYHRSDKLFIHIQNRRSRDIRFFVQHHSPSLPLSSPALSFYARILLCLGENIRKEQIKDQHTSRYADFLFIYKKSVNKIYAYFNVIARHNECITPKLAAQISVISIQRLKPNYNLTPSTAKGILSGISGYTRSLLLPKG